mmetsp:Transcript_43107/g.102717  ORF Transcript_43107/g.102717 Transcript_43107/m.102717 type:complete len:211 (-) Transcript_43107:67-699(-)
MSQLSQSGGREVEGDGCRHAKDLRGHVNLPHVHKDSRPHRDPLEGQMVVAERNLIVASGGVVAPSLRLHDLSGHRLEVEGVEHGRQWGLLELFDLLFGAVCLDGLLLLWCGLVRLWRLANMLRLDSGSINHSHSQGRLQELVHDVLRMDRVEDGGGIHARGICDELRAARVNLGELREVVGLAVKHDPAVLLSVVLGDLLHAQHLVGHGC